LIPLKPNQTQILGELMELHTDQIISILTKLGLTVDLDMTPGESYSEKTRKRTYWPRVQKAFREIAEDYRDSYFANLTELLVKERLSREDITSFAPEHRDHSRIHDTEFARLAIEESRKSIPEKDGRSHPIVGAVVVKDGRVLARAHRGEGEGNHAEYFALEKKLSDQMVAGATVYTTLEPCTTRNHPKIPCVERLIERKVARVVIGMLDPDPRITGRGQRRLREANIATDFFPEILMTEVEELNREFTRQFTASLPRNSHNQLTIARGTPDLNTLPVARPVVVPVRYGGGKRKNDVGYTGIAVRNDGERAAYDLSPLTPVIIHDAGRLDIAGTTARLSNSDEEEFFALFVVPNHGNGTFGSYLYSFMVENHLDSVAIPFRYRDADEVWYETEVLLIKDQMARSTDDALAGVRVSWRQKPVLNSGSVVTRATEESSFNGDKNEISVKASDPRIYLDPVNEEYISSGSMPFFLRNGGQEIAHDIQIHPVTLAGTTVSFEHLSHLGPGEQKRIFPNVEPGGVLTYHNILSPLSEAWDEANDLSIEEFPLKLKISYEDYSGERKFESRITLLYLPFIQKFALDTSLRSDRPPLEVLRVLETRFLRLM
jgi:pyrimidine deaminase RibD-like protein